MGRKRRQVTSSSQSGNSASDTSVVQSTDTTSTPKSLKKKSKTDYTVPDVKESLSRFAFQSRGGDMENKGDSHVEADVDPPDHVFSLERDSNPSPHLQGVTNEDIMLKLCANGAVIAKLSTTVEELRSVIFSLQTENDQLRKEVREVREREEEMNGKLAEIKFTAELADRRTEELSAYVRRNNLRIFGVEEGAGDGRGETAEECEAKVLSLFGEKLKRTIDRKDIEAVHRLGARKTANTGSSKGKQNTPRGIIVRFVSRRVRDSVLYARKLLRGSKVFMVEDLTPRAYALLCRVRDDTSVCKQAWTKNGKIMVKTLTGKIVNVESVSDLNNHRQACASFTERPAERRGHSSSATGGRNNQRDDRRLSSTSSTRM